MKVLQWKRLPQCEQTEKQLTRNYNTDAGLDIYTTTDIVIRAKESQIFSTGIAVDIPVGYVGLVRSRSGLGFKNDITAFHGTVDAGFHGELKVKLFNNGYDPYYVKKGDKIAQLVIVECFTGETEEVEDFPLDIENKEKIRGANGFGSSGN